MNPDLLPYQIALTLVPGVGDINGKRLVSYCGSVEAVFNETRAALMKIPGIGHHTVSSLLGKDTLGRAEEETAYILRNQIRPLFYTDSDYPRRLLNCDDSPLMLYYRGTANLNHPRMIAVVGTRSSTTYGKDRCREIIADLRPKEVMVVSGLAYGIDACAHQHSLNNGIETVAVMGHGHDRLYPAAHHPLAADILSHGGLLTEFMSGTKPDRLNFPKRNRIVAGMVDAILVVESDRKGGAMITAELGNSYNRDVFAVPGRTGDTFSRGCNHLIRSNRASLAESAKDICYMMGWDDLQPVVPRQRKLFVDLTADEKLLTDLLKGNESLGIDDLIVSSAMPASKVAAALVRLEFEGVVECLPGKRYRLPD